MWLRLTHEMPSIPRVKVAEPSLVAKRKLVLSHSRLLISAAKYGNTEGADGFKVFIVNQKDTVFFTLSAGKREFGNCVWKPAGEVTTIRINQTTAAKQRFYVKSITIYPKKAVETAIEQTTMRAESNKMLRNGQVVILREGKAYNLFGQEIAD